MTPGGVDAGLDLTHWQIWWLFNQAPYLDLKSAVHAGSVLTGSDEFYLGRGEQEQAKDSLKPSEAAIRGKLVPALLRALERERSNDIVTGCLIALAKIGDAKAEDGGPSRMAAAIRKKLGDPNQEIAETAAVALGILANESEIPLLTALLERDAQALRALNVALEVAQPERTRAFAAYGLGLIGAQAGEEGRRAIAAALVRMLDGEARRMSRDVPVACVTALGLTPLPLDLAAKWDDATNLGAQRKVESRQEQVLYLLRLLEDQELGFMVRAHVPTAMARLLADVPQGDWLREIVVARLLKDIGQHSKAQRELVQSSILALGQIADCDGDKLDQRVRSALMAVKDATSDHQARHFALIALAQIGARPGQGDGDPLEGLAEKNGSVRAFLIEQAQKGRGQVGPWALLALGVLERGLRDQDLPVSEASIELLRRELGAAKQASDVGSAAIALGLVGDPASKEILLEKLGRLSDPEALGACAIGLGLMHAGQAIEPITKLVEKSTYQPELLRSAAIALGLLGDKTIVDELIVMLEQAKALSSQAALSSALGFIGDARSIDPLIGLLEDTQKTDRARGFAAAALGIAADKEMLPWNAKISLNINYRASTSTLTAPSEGTGILDLL